MFEIKKMENENENYNRSYKKILSEIERKCECLFVYVQCKVFICYRFHVVVFLVHYDVSCWVFAQPRNKNSLL
jgi:hypothetical protein